MSSPSATVPGAVRTAFALYMAAAAVSAANAAALVHFHLAPGLVLANPVVELALYLGIGLPMRSGKLWARIGMFSVALLFILLNLLYTHGLTSAFGSAPTYQVVLLLVLVSGKVALLGAATWMMYRPQNQVYFG